MAEDVFAPGEGPPGLPAFDHQRNPQNLSASAETGNFAPRNTIAVPEQGEWPEMKIP